MLSEVPRDRTSGPVTRHDVALDDAIIAQCFAGLKTAENLLLAVSGGPDSVALLLMAVRWTAGLGSAAPALHVLTVDHGLRQGSRDEADMVAAIAADQGLPHKVLAWAGQKPSSRIQERARAARYALLADWARAVGATHVLTAHHADDQAETVLLRLGRGSGIGGLAGIRRLSPLAPDLTLVRPLLALSKADLVATCRAAGCCFVDDPSNHDAAYARARLRAQAPALAALGLDAAGLTRLARRMARADEALEREVDRLEGRLRPELRPEFFSADLLGTRDVAAEICIRLLRRAVAHVAGESVMRLERLESLAEAVWAALAAGCAHRATLAGTCVALGADGRLTIVPAPARRRGLVNRRSVP